MILTIAIPTYNRPDKIKNTVVRLLPQLTPDVQILILDNCSPVVVKDYLANKMGKDVLDKVKIVRHRVNVGGDVNFQRCFELSETPFTWMLGDDDEIEENAVELILGELERYKDHDLIGINFNSNCNTTSRTQPVIISSIAELSKKLDHFGNWLFISTSVYKTEEYLKHIRYQSWGAYSMASQLVPPMIAISKNKTFVLSEKYIVTNHRPEGNDKWSDFQLALSLSTLLEAPVGFKKDEFIDFGKKMATWIGLYPGDAFYMLLKSVNYDIDVIDDYHIYIFKQLYKRTSVFRSDSMAHLIQYHQSLFLLKNKWLLKLMLRLVPGIKARSEGKASFHLFMR